VHFVAGFLLVNPRSGSGRPDAEELALEAARLGIATHVLAEEDEPVELAREADADALGVAGGDGSLASIASVALERGLPFVCVPFGTRNHFARDLGLDRDDPIGALRAFGGVERRVDVGRVGGRAFLNNVSLGAYAHVVHEREHHRRRRAALARVRALAISVRHPHALDVRIDGRPVSARIVLVANNRYELDLLSLGRRERLDSGELGLYVARGFAPGALEEHVGPSFRLEAAEELRAAADGEPLTLEPPIEFRIEPRALRVLVPPARDDLGDVEGVLPG
jgi:diacylglycerol kinase family enzyme